MLLSHPSGKSQGFENVIHLPVLRTLCVYNADIFTLITGFNNGFFQSNNLNNIKTRRSSSTVKTDNHNSYYGVCKINIG